jgi:hypothetical protein
MTSRLPLHLESLVQFLAHSVSYPLVKYFLFWKGSIEDVAPDDFPEYILNDLDEQVRM